MPSSVVDNEFNGRRENVPPAHQFMRGDVTEPAEVEPVFARGLDAVCHIAGQVSIIRSFSDPVADLRTNVEGTLNILQLCLKYKVPRLIYASSMTALRRLPDRADARDRAVPARTPTTASPSTPPSATSMRPRERPDLGFDFRVTSLRMFSVYGPGQSFSNPYQGVLGIFAGNLLRGEPITIFGDGEQTRDFVYIDDIVEGWVRALNTPAAAGGVFNLGSGRSLSINQLAERAIAAFGHPPGGYRIIRAPRAAGRAAHVQADIRQAQVGARLGAANDLRSGDWRRRCAGPARSSALAPLPRIRGTMRDEAPARHLGRSVDAERVHGPQVRGRRPVAGPRGRRLRPGACGAAAACRSRPT